MYKTQLIFILVWVLLTPTIKSRVSGVWCFYLQRLGKILEQGDK